MNKYKEIKEQVLTGKPITDEQAEFLINRARLKAAQFNLSHHDREDAVATALVRFLDGLAKGKYKQQYEISTYLLKLVEYACKEKFNRKRKKTISFSDYVEDDKISIEPYYTEQLNNEKEVRNKLRKNLKAQIEQYVFDMLLKGYKQVDIAEKLQVTPQYISQIVDIIRNKSNKIINNI